MVFRRFFNGKPLEREEGYEEGRRLFEIGMQLASQYKCDAAIDYYTRSINVCPNPAPYINRANILCKRIRYKEALDDLREAKRLDINQGSEFQGIVDREIKIAELVTSNYRNGIRQKLLADYATKDIQEVARSILCASFEMSRRAWDYGAPASALLEYHFFNEIDNVAKFDDLDLHPEVQEFLESYPSEFVQHKVDRCPDRDAYSKVELTLHSFLCSYEERDMQYIRRNMLYDIHCRLMETDYGSFWMSMDSDCPGITKEAQSFMDSTS